MQNVTMEQQPTAINEFDFPTESACCHAPVVNSLKGHLCLKCRDVVKPNGILVKD